MALDDYLDREPVLAAGVTAAALSPRVRGLLRTGAVYGVAGVLKVGDVAAGAAKGVASGVRGATSGDEDGAEVAADASASTASGGQPRTGTPEAGR